MKNIDLPTATNLNKNVGLLPILNLDHPGANDEQYRARRIFIAEKALEFHHSKQQKIIPTLKYTAEEHRTWQLVNKKLNPLHQQWASQWYLEARKKLNLSENKIPRLAALSKKLELFSGFRLEPIHGLVEPKEFLIKLGQEIMLCTQYIRHASKPEFTPEPDIIHEVLGHVPMFLQPKFRAFSLLIGKAAAQASAQANEEQLQKLINLYWFTIEYGLMIEQGQLKAFGAGLLGGIHDLTRAMNDKVKLSLFQKEEIFRREINYSFPQEELFVIPSFSFLMEETKELLKEMRV